MKLGLGLITCQRYPGDERTDEDLYAHALDLAVLAERSGLDSVWVSEHHFVDDGYLPSLLPMCAAIAVRTERIEIGTALLLAPLYEPLRLAEDAAVVDLVSRGRLVLGLGLGWRAEEFDALGVPLRERVARLEGTIATLRQAWSGKLVVGSAEIAYPDVPVTPRPRRPGGPPLWIGALTEPAVRRAGRLGDGFMATEVTPESFAEQVRWAREERERAGIDPSSMRFSLHLPTFAYEGDEERAWSIVRPFHHYVAWKYDDMDAARSRTGPVSAPPPVDAADEAGLRSSILLGSPERVAERIGAFADAAGGDIHFIARAYWPGMEPSLQEEAVRILGERVAPLLR
jgi:alkanesulfonate monooxygenase SsuD/methylene tetrahydromethanopterin reductase-like flavin-dependent oxidoreductase (luciferase family)